MIKFEIIKIEDEYDGRMNGESILKSPNYDAVHNAVFDVVNEIGDLEYGKDFIVERNL